MNVEETLMPDETLEVTFEQTVDLSEFGEYEFSVFVNSPEDQNPANDILDVQVLKLPALAAALTGEVEVSTCTDSITPSLELTNNGANEITTAVILVNINGTNSEAITLDTNIATLESLSLAPLLNEHFVNGDNVFTFTLVAINGQPVDESDDSVLTLEAKIFDEESTISVQFTGDSSPNETSWILLDQDENVVANGALTNGQPNENVSICLDLNSCYDLVVLDSGGNGMCCADGAGSFGVLNGDGSILLINDGQFGSEVSETFCPSGEAAGIDDFFENSVDVMISPNPTEGVFSIQIRNFDLDAYLLDVDIYDHSGKLIQKRLIGKYDGEFIGTFSLWDYPAGQYYVRFSNGKEIHTEKIVKY